MTNVFFQFFSFFDIILLTIVYFSKKIFKTDENKIYSWLIIVSLIGQILHIFSYVTIYNMDKIPTINAITTKLYLVYLAVWASLLFLYICIVTYKYTKDKNYKKNVKTTKIYIAILNIIIILLLLMLPTYCFVEPNAIYTHGPSISLIYVVSIVYICLAALLFIKHFKAIVESGLKKYIPLLVFILIGSIVMMIQYINPSLLLITSCETFITFLMYFTIENPDLQMLREFHKQREYAEESNKEKSSFLFNMSNQVKQPLELINKISSEQVVEENIQNMKEDAKKIKSTSNELLQLVNNVLDISDLEKRKIEIRGNRYHVYNLFNLINKTFEKSIKKNIEYRFNYDKSIPEYLYGDSIRLKQIMNILLDNAKEYTTNGFIEVNINSIVKHDVCRLIITVEDSGIGMTTDQIKHLFDKEKIYSDELLKTIDDTQNNLGIAKSLVNLMNGSIMVNSDYGKGSKFTVVIDQKLKEEKTKIIEAVEKYEEIYENNQKVLLVIPEEETSKKLKRILNKYDIDIEIVKGGQACLERVRNNEKYDLIIIDENLPKLSSEDTLIKLKDTIAYKTPVILITSKKEIDTKDRFTQKGYSDVIFLPFKKEQVIKVIEEYIEK